MAKIKAPLLSLDATGTLDKNITYKKKLQNNIAQKYSQPGAKNPFESSPRQKDQRSIIRLITIHWQCMSSADQLSWNNAAKDARFTGTGYHYFLSKAQQNLTQYLGLVGYWSMNYNVDDKIPDLSGNGNHGILSPIYPCDCPTLVDSINKKQGKAASFNGLTNFLNCGSHSSLDLTNSLSVLALVKTHSLTASAPIVAKSYDSYFFVINSDYSLRLSLYQNGVLNHYYSSSSLTVSTFYHVAATFSLASLQIKFYINGEMDIPLIPISFGITPNFTSLGIGALNGTGASPFFNGLIDNVLLFNRTLSEKEIKLHYNSLI